MRGTEILFVTVLACSGKDTPTDGTTDVADADADTDADSDSDTDTDSDSDADADSDTDSDADTDPTEPLAVDVVFDARFGDEPLACGTVYDATPYGSATVEIGDFRLYLSEVALIDGTGAEVPVTLTDDGLWQGGGVTLLDFEDGTAQCATVGNAGLNDHVVGTAPAGTYTGLAFTVGVPFDQNHQDLAFAPAPLNVPAMFWIWQYGYKFTSIDLYNDLEAPGNYWAVHVGSNGCTAGSYYDAPTVECDYPNRSRVVLDGFDPASSTVVVDLAAMLTGANLDLDTPDTSPGCMSGDPLECPPVWENLGMDYATGACVDGCAGQTVFTVE
ncbi:MAG: MbnP family copper-binding protein [Myxococcota bacterium]